VAITSPTVVPTNGLTALKAAIVADRVDVIDALIDAGDPKREPYNAGKMSSNKAVQAALKRKPKR